MSKSRQIVTAFFSSLQKYIQLRVVFLSARKADLKKGFQHLVVLVVVVLVVVVLVGTRVKKRF
jgi:t-SNARE complex subunit (syntaxin)